MAALQYVSGERSEASPSTFNWERVDPSVASQALRLYAHTIYYRHDCGKFAKMTRGCGRRQDGDRVRTSD
eukprot:7745845-Alexandrium_andersonii.AAC.1